MAGARRSEAATLTRGGAMSDGESEPRRVGVRDVARVAGVSSQTVSRVINEHPNIRPETRAKVLDAMAALDYRVNNAARALGTRTTRTLGVIASDATLYGPAVGIAALESAARAGGPLGRDDLCGCRGRGIRRSRRHGTCSRRASTASIVVAPHARTLEALARRRFGVPVVALHGGPGARASGGGRGARGRATSSSSVTGAIARARRARRTGSRRSRATRASTRRSPRAASSPGRAGQGDWTAAPVRARGRDRGIRPRRRRPDGRRRRERPDGARAHRGAARMPASTCRATSASSGSTTTRMPRSTVPRSRPCGSTSPGRRDAASPRCCGPRHPLRP